MNYLIKEIRRRLKMTKDEFSSVLGVTEYIVNEWENGLSLPAIHVSKDIFEICKRHNLDLTEYIVNQMKVSSNGMILYHASRNGIKGDISPISNKYCDLGKGFYMGVDPIEPLKRVCNKKNPILYALVIDLSELKVLEVKNNMEWVMLLAYYRGYLNQVKGSALYEKYAHMSNGYDVIVGYIVNDQIYPVLTDFFEERVTDQALFASIDALNLKKQYVAITQKACDQISIISSSKLSPLELMFLKETSILRRHEGLHVTDQAINEQRKNGFYFDEILRGDNND